MRRTRSAKIIATLGPSSGDLESISALFEAGADVFRLNFSHGSHEDHKGVYDAIREVESRFDRPIGIILDLQGPKLRVGKFENGSATLEAGASFRLDLSEALGTASRAPLLHPEVFEAIEAGTDLLLDDGRIRLRVEKCGADFAETRVITSGVLSNNKGVNVPSVFLSVSPLTEKDRKDLAFGLDLGVDWVALSFVQRPSDIVEARHLIDGRASILSKLEKPQAIVHLEEIVDLSDAIMVARGDLGVEVPPEDVPPLQKRIIHACRHAGKPVVVATQMLESMIHAPTPTRAEASDVATAIYDGADAVMLSAETAVGDYPVEAVSMMERIVDRVERDPLYRKIMEAERHDPEATSVDAITAAARQIAATISAAAIVTFTDTGSTALRAARERPEVPIMGLTPSVQTARRLCLTWGIHAVKTRVLDNFLQIVEDAASVATKDEIAESGDSLVVIAGIPFDTPGATNILRIELVK